MIPNMTRLHRTSSAAILAALALSACSVTIAPVHDTNTATSADCQGGPNGCSVAEHEALTRSLPPVAADVSGQIHDYILAHPEIIAEAQRGLAVKQAAERQAQAKASLAANRDAVFFDPADPALGNPKGDVTLVEFFDNECPFCKKLAPEIAALIKADPNVRLVMKEFPILGPVSDASARFALAAKAQGRYAALHDALMASTIQEHQLTEAQILDFAKASGLDVERLKRDAATPEIAARIAATRALAQKLAITGTPGLVVSGTSPDSAQIVNARDLQGLQQAVNVARAQKIALR